MCNEVANYASIVVKASALDPLRRKVNLFWRNLRCRITYVDSFVRRAGRGESHRHRYARVNLDLEIAYSYAERGRCHSWTATRPRSKGERREWGKKKEKKITLLTSLSRKKSAVPAGISVNRRLRRRECEISIVNQTAPAGSLCRFWKSPQGFAARANFAFHRWLLPCTAPTTSRVVPMRWNSN